MRLLTAKRRREAEDHLARHRRSVAERKLKQWRVESGEDSEIPDDPEAASDDYRHIPVEMLDSWPQSWAA